MEDSIFQPHDLEHHLSAWNELNPEDWKKTFIFRFFRHQKVEENLQNFLP
jgi:hypothetical protein